MKLKLSFLLLIIAMTKSALALDLQQEIESFNVPTISYLFLTGKTVNFNDNKLLIGEQIGAGEHGVIYKIHYLGEDNAAKRTKTQNDKYNLIKEAVILKYLEGIKGVPKYKGIFEDKAKRMVLLMNLLRPVTGSDFNKNFALKLVETLNKIHKKDIGHNDLKIDNVLVDQEGNPTITDFGQAQQITVDSRVVGKDLKDLWDIFLHLRQEVGGMDLRAEYGRFKHNMQKQILEEIVKEYKEMSDENLKNLWLINGISITPSTNLRDELVLNFIAKKSDEEIKIQDAFLTKMSAQMDSMDRMLFDMMIGKIKTIDQAIERLNEL